VNNKNEIIFIGTSHIDPDGYVNVMDVLNSLSPELILLEVSPLSILLRRTYGQILKLILHRNIKILKLGIIPELRNVISYLELPHEYRAVKDYCRKTGSEFILADISLFTLFRFIHAHRLVTKRNLLALSGIREDRFIQEKSAADCIFNKKDDILLNMKLHQFRKDNLAMRRESLLLKKLNKYADRYSDKKIVYVGGWEHLLDDPEVMTLYTSCNFSKKRQVSFLQQR